MIILINGAFGVGKTTIATELLNQIPNSMLFDPEEVGYMLRSILTEDVKKEDEKTGDFQDFHLWKQLVVEVAKRLKQEYNRTLIVPMTIYKRCYAEYIEDGLKAIDSETYHFCLIAEKETIHKRLLERGEELGNWCFQQTDKCLSGFSDPFYKNKILTDCVPIRHVVDKIINRIPML